MGEGEMNLLCLILGHKWIDREHIIYNHRCIPPSDTFLYKDSSVLATTIVNLRNRGFGTKDVMEVTGLSKDHIKGLIIRGVLDETF